MSLITPHSVYLDMRIICGAGKVAVTGSTYFGEVDCAIARKTVSICNLGDCELHVSKVDFSRKRRHFRLINNAFPATLHPGSALGVVIEYRASHEVEWCELVIESDDPQQPVKMRDVVAFTRGPPHAELAASETSVRPLPKYLVASARDDLAARRLPALEQPERERGQPRDRGRAQ